LNPHPTRTEPDLGADFIFHPWVHLKPKKPKKTLKGTKKPERNPNKTRKNAKLEEKPYGNLKKLKRNTFSKPDGHPIFTHGCGFGCQIQPHFIFSRVGFLIEPTHYHP
jgi:hypothetical protein